jgi:hypothetical protein
MVPKFCLIIYLNNINGIKFSAFIHLMTNMISLLDIGRLISDTNRHQTMNRDFLYDSWLAFQQKNPNFLTVFVTTVNTGQLFTVQPEQIKSEQPVLLSS